LEVLSRAQALIFDKTGTITLGLPKVSEFINLTKKYSDEEILAISQSIERSSLHPLAKAVVLFAKENKVPLLHAEKIEEKIGSGISGIVKNKTYTLSKLTSMEGMMIGVFEGKNHLATFKFEDEIKQESKKIIQDFKATRF
jgi:P-type E1-E2 ATPase